MFKEIEEMTVEERRLFDIYADLEWALAEEYELMDADNVSGHLKGAVGSWSTVLHGLGLIDDYLHGQAQKMAKGDDSWVNS